MSVKTTINDINFMLRAEFQLKNNSDTNMSPIALLFCRHNFVVYPLCATW